MWKRTGQLILNYRILFLTVIGILTGYMVYQASGVQMSYEFGRAIPTDNPRYKDYQEFRSMFGEDGNLMVLGFTKEDVFQEQFFNSYADLRRDLKAIKGVEDIISVPSAINLRRSALGRNLEAVPVFPERNLPQSELDSSRNLFLSLPFYRDLLYNPETGAWLMGLRLNKEIINTKKRTGLINEIIKRVDSFSVANNLEVHRSGLPLIRTQLTDRVSREMQWFLVASLLLSAAILLVFFRSITSMLLSLGTVIIGVLWSLGTMHMLGYKITLLTALIPPLIVVIGIPNCIYFLTKYHSSYSETRDKRLALVTMVERMGIVTLFCNLAAAIGFAVFALTRSEILREFGIVAGINILLLFFISLILIPSVLSLMPTPKIRHTKYLESPRLHRWLDRLERWSLNHRRLIFTITIALVAVSILGMFRLKSVGYIVDDLPKKDRLYTDLKFFETHFKGVMPLEIVVDTRKRNGVRNLETLRKVDSLSNYMEQMPGIGRALTITEGLKFARQAFFSGDSNYYSMPLEYDMPAMAQYLRVRKNEDGENSFARLVSSFMDSSRQRIRISVNMADVGSERLPFLLDSIRQRSAELFDTTTYAVKLTGTSVTFLEGMSYIINGLKESIFWAFLLIALCMLYLFRSWRILVCSLVPNIIPLIITAGVMGWTGVPLKPSTVLIFSVALGIAIDITIRFLVSYKQDLKQGEGSMKEMVIRTIHHTGISIIYTSLVLVAGFIIFCFSRFGGTMALGWLTSLTLVTATVTNLVLLPSLLIWLIPKQKKNSAAEKKA